MTTTEIQTFDMGKTRDVARRETDGCQRCAVGGELINYCEVYAKL